MRENAIARIELTTKKNSNYAGGGPEDNALKNFDMIEIITSGKVSREIGMLVRMTDKLARLGTLLAGGADAVGESVEDSLEDLANYADLTLVAVRDKRESKTRETVREIMDKNHDALEALAKAEQLEFEFDTVAHEEKYPNDPWDKIKGGDTPEFRKPYSYAPSEPTEDESPKSILSRFFSKIAA